MIIGEIYLFRKICYFPLLILLFHSCSTTYQIVLNKDIQTVERTVKDTYTEIGFNVKPEDDSFFLDGRLNRDAKLTLIQINRDSTEIKFVSSKLLNPYNEYLAAILKQNIEDKRVTNSKLKSHKTFNVLNIISPGIGYYYFSKKSIYWKKNNLPPSLIIGATDAFFIYQSIRNKNEVPLIPSIAFRIVLGYWGNYFINYDNKILKVGYSIKF